MSAVARSGGAGAAIGDIVASLYTQEGALVSSETQVASLGLNLVRWRSVNANDEVRFRIPPLTRLAGVFTSTGVDHSRRYPLLPSGEYGGYQLRRANTNSAIFIMLADAA